MRFLIYISILFFCNLTAFGQKLTPVKKKISKPKIVAKKFELTPEKKETLSINGNYVITKFYIIDKKLTSKNDIKKIINSKFIIDKDVLNGPLFNKQKIKIYETQTIEKNDYLYRIFNQKISQKIEELQSKFTILKIESKSLKSIAQMNNKSIAFPYKGGLIIAELIKE